MVGKSKKKYLEIEDMLGCQDYLVVQGHYLEKAFDQRLVPHRFSRANARWRYCFKFRSSGP